MKTRSTSRPDAAEERRNAAGSRPAAQMKPTAVAVMPDARAASLAQLRQQEQAGNSTQAAQLKAHAELMAGGGADAPLQRVEGDELLQGKFDVAQREVDDDEELLQGKFEPVQKMDEEELLQGKFEALQRKEVNTPLQGEPAQRAAHAASGEEPVQRQEKPNDTGLPDQLKSGIESLSGMSMDHVKVHYNSDKPGQLQAHAYAQGSEIHVAPGQERHVPHEAWHVVQQAEGRVAPTTQAKGVAINDDKTLENEADAMGMKAMTATFSEDSIRLPLSIVDNAIQRHVIQKTIGIGTDAAVEQKSLILLAVRLTDYMGDYDYALASLTALDGNNYDTMDLLRDAMPEPLTADQVYVGGAAVTIAGTGDRCNEHMGQDDVVAALRVNKRDITIANGNEQRIQIGRGRSEWKLGYVMLRFRSGELQYWHAHEGFRVG
jgi:chaperonin cofactor prefoldin